jgi:hypothetical protein
MTLRCPVPQIFTGPTRAVGKLDNASSARLRYDSFQLLSSATVHDVSRLKPNL